MHTFPFAAVIANEPLKLALILNAIDPRIGGVLVSGPRGSAKSTLARALAAITEIPAERFVTLPLGATEERVIGSIDVEKVLHQGQVSFHPGLLYQAHEGILYVDEVNLLADSLVDLLLDVAASGINTIERDGISKSHASQFVLIGTMNPDEGELRPQLLDRFGLCVHMQQRLDTEQRMAIVQRRVAFDADPQAFIASYDEQQTQLKSKIREAKDLLDAVKVNEACQRYICQLCAAAQVEGVRADITLLRAAKALSAWQGKTDVSTDQVDQVSEFVLAHRRQQTCPAPAPSGAAEHTEQEAPPNPSIKQDMSAGADPNHDATAGMGDWGELPPVPVASGIRRNVQDMLTDTPRQKKKRLKSPST